MKKKKVAKLSASDIKKLSAGVGSMQPSRTRPFEVSQIRGNIEVATRAASDYRTRK